MEMKKEEEEIIEPTEEEKKEIRDKFRNEAAHEKFANSLHKITYKTDLLCYFVKNIRKTLNITKEEFSGFVCSGIVPILVDWIENEFIEDGEEGKEEPKFTVKQFEEATAAITSDVQEMFR